MKARNQERVIVSLRDETTKNREPTLKEAGTPANEKGQSSLGAGLRASFAWRGREGSAKDIGSNLVYMQNRHYDPSIGRFIQADSLLLASLTTQGMNRYIYTENDPVNKSDPSGMYYIWVIIGVIIFVALVLAALFKFFSWLDQVSRTPRRCVTELDTSLADRQTLQLITQGLEDSLPPGMSATGPVSAPTQPANTWLDLFFIWLGWADETE